MTLSNTYRGERDPFYYSECVSHKTVSVLYHQLHQHTLWYTSFLACRKLSLYRIVQWKMCWNLFWLLWDVLKAGGGKWRYLNIGFIYTMSPNTCSKGHFCQFIVPPAYIPKGLGSQQCIVKPLLMVKELLTFAALWFFFSEVFHS